MSEEWVSECCSAPEQDISRDIGLCTECHEHCDYIDIGVDEDE